MNRSMVIPRLQAPVVFVPGLLGYGEVRLFDRTLLCYFANLPAVRRAAGNAVYVARVHPVASVAYRAWQLRGFVERVVPKGPVHLTAHSMGGLDARYLISRLGMAGRVLSLTTLGTPHRGTAFADWGIRRVERVVKPLFDLLGLARQAFHDLTRASCAAFNDKTPDAPGVRYFSVAGRFTPGWLTPEWQLPWRIVHGVEGPNDGLVSVTSATWGESCDVWEGDHASLVNRAVGVRAVRGPWRDRVADYAALLQRLADAGFA